MARINEATDHRNKIFHGQLTSHLLSREELIGFVTNIRAWCHLLATGAVAEVGYDGMERDSFRKSDVSNLSVRYKLQLKSFQDYSALIRAHMERQRRVENNE
jgi:hypothetical protein